MRQAWLFGLACGAAAALLLGLAQLAPVTALLYYGIPLGPLLGALAGGPVAGLLASLAFLVVALPFAPAGAGVLFVALALPAGMLGWLALQRRGSGFVPAGFLLGSVVLGGALIGIAAQIAIGSQEEEATRFLAERMEALTEPGPGGQPQLSRAELESLIAGSLRAAPVGVGMLWVLVMTVNGALAQAIARGMGRNQRPTPRYSRARVPDWVLYAMGGALLVGLLPDALGRIGTTVGFVLAMAYLLQGLAVVHAFARRTGGGMWLLVPFYLLLLVIGPLMPFAVVVLGLVEDHVRYRDRDGGPVGKEEE